VRLPVAIDLLGGEADLALVLDRPELHHVDRRRGVLVDIAGARFLGRGHGAAQHEVAHHLGLELALLLRDELIHRRQAHGVDLGEEQVVIEVAVAVVHVLAVHGHAEDHELAVANRLRRDVAADAEAGFLAGLGQELTLEQGVEHALRAQHLAGAAAQRGHAEAPGMHAHGTIAHVHDVARSAGPAARRRAHIGLRAKCEHERGDDDDE
jgi:hypothetical protein